MVRLQLNLLPFSQVFNMSVIPFVCRLAGDQRARRDMRNDSDAEDDDDVKKVSERLIGF